MRKNCINKNMRFVFVLSIALLTASCNPGKEDSTKKHTAHEHKAQEYTCPMHPQIVREKPGKCPICGMDLVPKSSPDVAKRADSSLAHLLKPVTEQVVSAIPVITPDKTRRILSASAQGVVSYDTRNHTSIAARVSGRIEKLYIKYNYQPVNKGMLIMEIYAPDLAAAQRELIYLVNSNASENMVQSAKQRLLLLGMTEAQLNKVITKGEPLYRFPVYSHTSGYLLQQTIQSAPQAGTAPVTPAPAADGMSMTGGAAAAPAATGSVQNSNTPILLREGQYVTAGQSLFTVYSNQSLVAEFAFPPALAASIKKGKQLLYYVSSNSSETYTGNIALVQPVFKAGQNFTQVRVYTIPRNLKIGQQLTANLAIATDQHYWLPQEAVLDMGNSSVIFKKEGHVFIPKTVKAGIKAQGFVEILDNIGNWQIAGKAYYLVDSESFIPVTPKTK